MPRFESVRALLANMVDYAGLFPPAKLDMANTVNNYARYLQSDEQWMLGRMIVPVSRLDEFAQAAAEVWPHGDDVDHEPWQISAITAAAGDRDALQNDLARIDAFNVSHGIDGSGRAEIDVIELKADRADDIGNALDVIPGELFPYLELPIDRDPRGLIAALADGDAAAKVRTGGITADAVPAPEHVARFISACAAARVPFKATAGLHHPLRHFAESIKAQEFGFLNIFIAGCVVFVQDIEESTLRQLLEEQHMESFTFDDGGVAWRELRVSVDDILTARELFAVSFGSCSIDEPIADLKSLKLL